MCSFLSSVYPKGVDSLFRNLRYLSPSSTHKVKKSRKSFCRLMFNSTIHSSASKNPEAIQENSLSPLVPIWSESCLCPYGTSCRNGECDQLHFLKPDLERRWKIPEGNGKVVICAGPERSGSTWLYNALRLMLQSTDYRTHSYWLHKISTKGLKSRGYGRQEDGVQIVVKTHEWSDSWNPKCADVIAVTERDPCDVINSYLRVGWLHKDIEYLKTYLSSYLSDHEKWKSVSHIVIPFEDIIDVGGQEVVRLRALGALLGFDQGINYDQISNSIKNLPVSTGSGPDPVTKLWPRHLSSNNEKDRHVSLSESEREELNQHVGEFYRVHSNS